jgi:hypothetical protein
VSRVTVALQDWMGEQIRQQPLEKSHSTLDVDIPESFWDGQSPNYRIRSRQHCTS